MTSEPRDAMSETEWEQEIARLHNVIDSAGYHATSAAYAALHDDVKRARAFVHGLAALRAPAQLGSALVEALREVPLDGLLEIMRLATRHGVWIDFPQRDEEQEFTESDATRRLSALLAAFPQEDSR